MLTLIYVFDSFEETIIVDDRSSREITQQCSILVVILIINSSESI